MLLLLREFHMLQESHPVTESEASALDSDRAEIEYRAISPLAIVALSLGMAAAVALAHPLMWWLPFAASLVALAALRGIARSGGSQTGKWIALTAICLSIFFFSWAVTRVVTGRRIEQTHARTIADAWLSLVQDGDWYNAHQWTVSGWNRQREGTVLKDFYESDADAKASFEKFKHEVVEHTLANTSPDDRFEFRGGDAVANGRNRRIIQLTYDRYVDGKGQPVPVIITVERSYDAEIQLILWQVLAIE